MSTAVAATGAALAASRAAAVPEAGSPHAGLSAPPCAPQACVCLSPVDRRVLLHLAHGWERGEICVEESMAEGVLTQRLTRLYGRLDVRSHAQAVDRGHAAGVLPRERFPRPFLLVGGRTLLGWIAAGLRNSDIAGLTGARPGAVASATHDLYRRLSARNRPHAVHIGWCTGILGGDRDV